MKKKLPSLIKLKHKLDKLMQDFYRRNHRQCEACGMKATVAHHHHPKSRSNNLRYDEDNLIQLCQGCHFKHHKGDPSVAYAYRQFRLPGWEDDLIGRSHVYKKWSRSELEELISKYGNNND